MTQNEKLLEEKRLELEQFIREAWLCGVHGFPRPDEFPLVTELLQAKQREVEDYWKTEVAYMESAFQHRLDQLYDGEDQHL